MNTIRRAWDLILFGNVYVALGAVCLIQSTRIQLGSANDLAAYSSLCFFATLFIYNLQRLFYSQKQDNSLHSVRRKWIFSNQKSIWVLTLTGACGLFVSFFYNDIKLVFYLSPLLLLTLAYFLPFIRLRKSPWFKLVTLTVVWTMVTAVVPILLLDQSFDSTTLLHIIVRLTFMIAICIPFDIRDLEIDKADNVSTLPHIMGEKNTRIGALIFMVTYCILIVAEYNREMFGVLVFIALLGSAIINTTLVVMTSSKRNEYFYVAGIDGTMILQGVLLIAAYHFR